LRIHQLKVPAKMRELLLQNLLELLNLKKECQRNQIPKRLKEQLELLDQVIELQLRAKFKMSSQKPKLRKLLQLQQLPSQLEFQTDQTNTKKLREKTELSEDQQDFLGLKKSL